MKTMDWTIELGATARRISAVCAGGEARAWADLTNELLLLDDLLGRFGRAIAEGSYDDVIHDAPRLVSPVRQLGEQSRRLRAQTRVLLGLAAGTAEPGLMGPDLADLCRHVQSMVSRASSLVHDAVDVDLGGPG